MGKAVEMGRRDEGNSKIFFGHLNFMWTFLVAKLVQNIHILLFLPCLFDVYFLLIFCFQVVYRSDFGNWWGWRRGAGRESLSWLFLWKHGFLKLCWLLLQALRNLAQNSISKRITQIFKSNRHVPSLDLLHSWSRETIFGSESGMEWAATGWRELGF